jgi:hypothetical protein
MIKKKSTAKKVARKPKVASVRKKAVAKAAPKKAKKTAYTEPKKTVVKKKAVKNVSKKTRVGRGGGRSGKDPLAVCALVLSQTEKGKEKGQYWWTGRGIDFDSDINKAKWCRVGECVAAMNALQDIKGNLRVYNRLAGMYVK